jgi:sn-glycerol 3-phosphate transport system ATP-binding protein
LLGPELRIDELSKAWGAVRALDALTFAIPAGSFTVLLGASGCGKTTCLRVIAGLDQPTSGRVLIGGRDVTAFPPAARGVAMVFQSYALFPHLNVAENILFGLRARGVSRSERDRRLHQAVDLLGIRALLSRKPSQISGGQQQRVALGRAIVAQAPVCLMDEPLSNLDAQLRAEMRREIVALQHRLGLTMVYVTHDQTEAMSMADQVVVLRSGKLEQAAPPADIYEHPATLYVAGFIGSPPMNLLPLEVRGAAMVIAGTDGPPLALRTDAPTIAGIRPEALSPVPLAAALSLSVEHSEYLGADTVLTGRVAATPHKVQARLPGRHSTVQGDIIRLGFLPDAVHLFHADTGTRCAQAAPAVPALA